jgi:hypothetical protein
MNKKQSTNMNYLYRQALYFYFDLIIDLITIFQLYNGERLYTFYFLLYLNIAERFLSFLRFKKIFE